jgi:DNA-binding transcriptional regulator PaaX
MIAQTGQLKPREATKHLLLELLEVADGITFLLSRPSDFVSKHRYFLTDGTFDRVKFRRTIRHAKNYGYIKVKGRGDTLTVGLSEAGHEKALKYSIDDVHIPEPLVWDKKWRMVMFDIPEERRLARNIFKAKLDELGFAQVQKSSYVHPYPCHNEIDFMRSLYGLDQYVRLAIIDKLEGEDELRKRFELK